MTTIAYRNGTMASDSKCTNGFGAHVTKLTKIYRLATGALLGVAGDADCRDVRTILDKCKTARTLPSRDALAKTKTDFHGLLVLRNESMFDIVVGYDDEAKEWYGSVVEIREGCYAVGSGQQFAIGAMGAGASAENAVRVACRYDNNSGEPVRSIALKEAKGAKHEQL